jgi:photosystem II stability/assembly factor-like uncharacterized protein
MKYVVFLFLLALQYAQAGPWVAQTSTTTDNLEAVTFVSAMQGSAVGDGTILITVDGGATWTSQISLVAKLVFYGLFR